MDENLNENNVAAEPETADETVEQAKKEYSEIIENAEKINSEESENEKAKKKKDDDEESSPYSILFDIVSIIATSAIIVGFAFIFCFRTVGVSGSSMYPTLKDGDRIILSAFITEPKYGEIVVTCQPSSFDYIESTLVKRVIATEGQTVDIDFTEGVVYVDGIALDEPYINEPPHEDEGFQGPVTVPEGYVFVMGDNRNASTDSRDFRVGFIREDYIMGKALFRIAPFGKFKIG